MSTASLLWDALLSAGAYAQAMWPWWMPVLLAVTTSIAVRTVRARRSGGDGAWPGPSPDPDWARWLPGVVWLGSTAVFMTIAG